MKPVAIKNIGRMNVWLGPNGEGLMDAFNPADLDIGVQFFGDQQIEELDAVINEYADITDRNQLAMPNVAIDGIDYTANVITDPERFHILEGKTCSGENEVVLTEFVAADFGVIVGDSIQVSGENDSETHLVSGIYQCANDMGDNIGMSREAYPMIGRDAPQIWCHHLFLSNPAVKDEITEVLKARYGGDVHVHENSWPGLFGIISAMHDLIGFMYVGVILFILIVTGMTASCLLFIEQKEYGIYKAVGFTSNRLRLIFSLCFGLIALIGSLIGTIIAAFLTDLLVEMVIKYE